MQKKCNSKNKDKMKSKSEWKNKVITFLMSILQMLLNFCTATINKSTYTTGSSKFVSLMPKSDVDITTYESAIDFAFDESQKINNVALMGAYGSGKSSIMNTYESKHPEKKFLHISLARFGDNTSEDNINVDENKISNTLEGKILNQLIHQIKPSKIKESNFNIKKTKKWWEVLIQTFAMAFVFFSVLFLVFYEKWYYLVNLLEGDSLDSTLEPEFKLGVLIICAIIIMWSIGLLLVRKGYLRYLKKVEVKNVVGIEVFDSKTDSSFDKYLNEVVYLFENCGVDAIVFEDLDRYETTLIFEKLREINYLVNKRDKNKTLKFFYLIKDDIFLTADRIKFFDFIIPIIPVVDVSNASEKLSELLSNAELENGLDEHFINDLSFFINDMRLLTNIVNEYKIYSKTIPVVEGYNNANHQFAMIVYKNLFPEDFHALQSGSGYVYSIFNYKNKLCDERTEQLKKEREEIQKRINSIHSQALKNIDELNALYFPLNQSTIRINGKDVPDGTSRVELIKEVINNSGSVWFRKNSSYYDFNVDVAMQKMTENKEYYTRRAELELMSSEKLKAENGRLSKITKDIDLISTERLKVLLAHHEDEEEFWNEINKPYLKDKKSIVNDRNYNLIKYLIRNGYINEDYSVYSSYFYSTELSVLDRNFILAVYNGNSIPYDYKLDNPEKVIENLNPSSFLLRNVNNNDLLNYIVNNDREDLLSEWFKAIENNGKEGYEFIIEFWRLNPTNIKLIRYINSLSPHWLKTWVANELITDVDFIDFILKTIEFCDNNMLSIMNYDNWLTKKISLNAAFLNPYIDNKQKYCEVLKSIDVKFINLKCAQSDNRVLKYVYNNNMYEINIINIIYLLDVYNRFDFDVRHFEICSFIFKNQVLPISKYLLENIDAFISLIIKESKKKFKDDQNTIAFLLNHKDLSFENKVLYLEKSLNKVNDIAKIESIEILPTLLKSHSIKNTWRNLCLYYKHIECNQEALSKELVNSMCTATGPSILRLDKLNNLLTTEVANRFRNKIIQSTIFSVDCYRNVLSYMRINYKKFPFSHLTNWQLLILLESNTISKTKENYNFIKQNYSKNVFDFILLGDRKKVFDLIEADLIVLEKKELLDLLVDSRIDNNSALLLLNKVDGPISIEGKSYSDDISEEIVRSHLNIDDLPWILHKYNYLGKKTKQAVIDYSLLNASRIINLAKSIKYIPTEVYAKFIRHHFVSVDVMIDLRRFLENNNFESLCSSGKSPTFENTQYNQIILDYFVNQGWISSYRVVNNKLRGYPKRKAS